MALAFSFRPRLLDALVGYDRARFVKDLAAGLTVAVVALPLAMAFAIASGLKPEAGIFTAIIAGFLISSLGGSRVQIGGPAGAFIVIVYGIVERYGVANLILATALSGVLLFLMGLLRLGTLVRFIPIAVIIGFTNGIAVLIALSQVKDFLGLSIAKMPGDFFGILGALWGHLHSFNPWALGVAAASLTVIVGWQRWLPALGPRVQFSGQLSVVPGSIVALVLATAVVGLFGLPVDTIGSRFGGIPGALPAFAWPAFSWESARFLLMPTITLALLGAIESLLCARVADGMIGDRHDPNQELMAQGVANFITPFFGGMPATGTIARTVTNVKNGATSPVAGMTHALVLLVVILVAAPLASSIPLACLAAILMHVAWNMGEWREFARLKSYRMPYRVTLVAVFLLTVIFDLTVAVEFGILAACVVFIYRISSLSRGERLTAADQPALAGHDAALQVWRLYGALFFGATKLVEALEDALPARVLVLDLKNVIYVDSTGAEALENLLQTCRRQGVRLVVSGLMAQPLDIARRTGLLERLQAQSDQDLQPDVASAIDTAVAGLAPVDAPATAQGDAEPGPART
ncbi:MAG TPA: SulP family inorganic anion transporter [Ottowia sp.]|uniref:SulP family inorganic anion transporter n=1 Tax=Ottowia sp. TaxID=1898956 RepID=UPI002D0B7353|nr:SulP family inorganic anion transporter [Ottowia sp.]MCZ2088048.1 STAS domain-containing protein [Burkholderiales bacterium]HNL41230.1 SulP family inorganic anion transporter [Ottowia sp.]HNR83058.1 SulP family inorganic anion transporter [Ottowia sp.]HNT84823.1 SulP family inorganic anion transporter [Ottowia sp.]